MKVSKLIRTLLVGLGLGVTPDVTVDLTDAPGGDLSLDDIFGGSSETPTTVATTPNPQETQTTTPEEPFIRTKTGTVYKNSEDAVKGIEHKDALIAQLRSELKTKTGNDPLVSRSSSQPTSYSDNPDKYFEEISNAVTKGDKQAYMEVQRKLIMDTLSPMAPTLSALSRANAERVVSNEISEFKGFVGSDHYNQILEQTPLLKDAILSAEMNPAAAGQLPELYKVAYWSSVGRRTPELVQSVQQTQQHATPPRPTVHSAAVIPPPQTNTAPPSLDTKEGRAEIIRRQEAAGVMNLRM